jgi:hypothetical protein
MDRSPMLSKKRKKEKKKGHAQEKKTRTAIEAVSTEKEKKDTHSD